MKTSTKRFSLYTVLLAVLFALTLCLGIAFTVRSHEGHAEEETGLVPFFGDELKESQSAKTGAGMVYWAADQMRLYFKFNGVTAPDPQTAGGHQMGPDENVNKIKVTIAGVTKPVLEWLHSDGGSGWISAMEGAVNPRDPDVFELWFCDNKKGWLPQVEYVTIGEGFQWYSGGQPVADATVAKDYILRNDGNAGGWTKVDEIPALETGLVPVYGAVLKDSASSRTFPAGGSTVYWSSNQMRLYFKFNGVTKPDRQAQGELNVDGNAAKIELTIDGQTKPLTEYLALSTGGWLYAREANVNGDSGPADPEIFEAWICDNSAGWLQQIQYVTIKAGFQWYNGGQPVAGATVQKDYILKKDGNNWLKVDSIPKEDISLSLLSQSEVTGHFDASADTTEGYQGKLGAFWSPTQMRLYFKAAGETLPTGSNPGAGVYTNSDKIYLTDATGTKSLAEWHTDGKFSWADFAPYGSTGPGYGQIVICSDAHPEWLAGIKSVTVKAGFQWLTAVDTPAGYVTKEDFTIYNGGVDDGWLAEDPDAEVPDITVTPLAGDDIQNGPFHSNENGKGVLWDPTQMRLYFKVEGLTTTLSTKHGQHFYDNNEKIRLIAADGTSATIKGWHDAGKIAWADTSKHALDAPDYLEIWINCGQSEENKAWLASISHAIIEEGFQLVDDSNVPIRGAVVKTTVYLEKDENGNWVACTEEDIPKPDTALVPMYGTPSTLWDSTQMRVFFTFEGMARPADEQLGGVNKIYNGDKFEITDASGTTKTVAEWAEEGPDRKISWFAPFNGGHYLSTTTAEFWIAIVQGDKKEENITWLAGIQKITIKAGFQWETAAGPLEGAVVKEDITLWNGGTAGWQRYADEITATLKDGEVSQGDSLENHLTVKAKYGSEEEEITGYTLEGYDPMKTGEAQEVTVKYQDKETTVSVTVTAAEKELTSIELSGKTEFTVRRFEELSTEGLIVTAKFSDESEDVLETGYTIEPFDPWTTESTVTLKVSYAFAGKTCDATITVNVTEPDTSKGMLVQVGNSVMWPEGNICLYFTFEGIPALSKPGSGPHNAFGIHNFPGNHISDYIIFTMQDGSTKTYTQWQPGNSDWAAVSEDFATGGTGDENVYKLVINLHNGKDALNDIVKVTVKAGFQLIYLKDANDGSAWGTPEHAKYQNCPEAIVKEDVILWKGAQNWEKGATALTATYTGGDVVRGNAIDRSKLTVQATYYDKTTADVTDYELDESALSEVGTGKTVTVTYRGISTTFTVNVVAPAKEITGISIPDNTKIEVKQFEEPDFSKIVVTVTYNDQTSDTVTIADCTLTEWSTLQKGSFDLTVTYEKDGVTVSAQNKIALVVGDPDLSVCLTFDENSQEVSIMSGTQVRVPFKFIGIDTPDKNLRQVELVENRIVDFVEVTSGGTTKTLKQLLDDGTITWVGLLGPHLFMCILEGTEKDAANREWLANITKVTIKAGLQWITADIKESWNPDAVDTKTYRPLEDAIVKQDFTVWNKGGEGWAKPAAAIKAEYKGGVVHLNDRLLLSNVSLQVQLEAGGDWTFLATSDPLVKFDYDFSQAGERTVTVTYQDLETTFKVTVTASEVKSIKLEKQPEKTTYFYGMRKVDLDGAVIKAVLSDGSEETVDLRMCTVSELDPYLLGEQTVTITYAGQRTSFKVTMAMDATYGMTVDWMSGLASHSTEYESPNLCIPFVLNVPDANDARAIIVLKGIEHVYDYVLINGKTLTEWGDSINYVGFYRHQFVIVLKGDKLVWSTSADGKTGNEGTEPNVYKEGTSEVVETVEFKVGFQWYTSQDSTGGPTNDGNYWDVGAADNSKYVPIEGAALKERVILRNLDGFGWERPIKKDDNTAITIKTNPDKTEYKLGERFSARGMSLSVKFEDGGTGVVQVADSWVKGYDANTLGEQTLTVTYAGVELTFTVNVTEAKEGCGSVIGTSGAIVAILTLCGAAAVVRRKRK